MSQGYDISWRHVSSFHPVEVEYLKSDKSGPSPSPSLPAAIILAARPPYDCEILPPIKHAGSRRSYVDMKNDLGKTAVAHALRTYYTKPSDCNDFFHNYIHFYKNKDNINSSESKSVIVQY